MSCTSHAFSAPFLTLMEVSQDLQTTVLLRIFRSKLCQSIRFGRLASGNIVLLASLHADQAAECSSRGDGIAKNMFETTRI